MTAFDDGYNKSQRKILSDLAERINDLRRSANSLTHEIMSTQLELAEKEFLFKQLSDLFQRGD